MQGNQYLGRQPIINSCGEIAAYELFYRDEELCCDVKGRRFVAASVISCVLNKFGAKNLLGRHRAFIISDSDFLLHDMILSIPKDLFVFSLAECIEVNERLAERVEHLYCHGYMLAINDIALSEETIDKFVPILNFVHFCKIDSKAYDSAYVDEGIRRLKQYPLQLIATKVESHAEFETFQSLGMDLFQGYYFAKPNILESRSYDPTHVSVIKLCNLLMSDASIDEIADAFESNHAIAVHLLQFINSAAFHFTQRISSIKNVLTLVGRNPLTQWLMLMIYSKSVSRSESQSPLILMVKSRTELMTGLLKLIEPGVDSGRVGEAYFVGVLSLIDVLFSVELEEVLNDLNVSPAVKDALLKKEGQLGEIYGLIPSIEHFDSPVLEEFIYNYSLDPTDVAQMMVNAIESVNMFEEALKSEQMVI